MNTKEIKNLVNFIEDNMSSLDKNVMHIHGEALDNISDVVDTNIQNDEFYKQYLSSVEFILACCDFVTDEGIKFYVSQGVKF